MKKTRSAGQDVILEEITVPSFGYDLIREELLPNILGKDTIEILYWAGKSLARSYPFQTIEETIVFFEKAGWGQLSVKKETKDELLFELTSPLIIQRLQSQKDTHFKIESGFLAQQISDQKRMMAEANEQVYKKTGKVDFTVRWDKKDLF